MSAGEASDAVLRAIRRVLPEGRTAVLHEPELRGREIDYVSQCIQEGYVSSVGRAVDEFERTLAERCDVERAVAVVNGTAALHASLVAQGVAPGDEVLVPALGFVAAANAVTYCGATPHFVDCERRTLGVDAEKLAAHLARVAECEGGACRNRETGARIAALVVVDVFGHPAEIEGCAEVARRFGLRLLEDGAAALGSTRDGRPVGGQAELTTLSFNGNKIVTTGGGGAVLTDDAELADRLRHLTTTAKRPHPWRGEHDAVGFNYRMPNLNAALGVAQLERLDDFLKRKRLLADAYERAFADVAGARILREPAGARSNYWLNTLVLNTDFPDPLDTLLERLHGAGVHARPVWTPLHRLPMYREAPRMDLATCEEMAARLVNLPSSPALADTVRGAP